VVIFGHSRAASETVALAKRLNALSIPVLLTVQMDSVTKTDEDDALIPPNVKDAILFFQTEGLLHGRRTISAANPKRTIILGNCQSSCQGSGRMRRLSVVRADLHEAAHRDRERPQGLGCDLVAD
jgi:hypothetical protein